MKYLSFYLLVSSSFLTSCQIYRNHFDCPPCGGVPCTSVTKLEQMIVETDEGADVFLGQSLSESQRGMIVRSNSGKKGLSGKKIWVADIACGGNIENHYIYLPE